MTFAVLDSRDDLLDASLVVARFRVGHEPFAHRDLTSTSIATTHRPTSFASHVQVQRCLTRKVEAAVGAFVFVQRLVLGRG